MTLLPPLATLIPKDHPLYRLNRVLDLSFVHEVVRDRYCQDNGRPSIDPPGGTLKLGACWKGYRWDTRLCLSADGLFHEDHSYNRAVFRFT